ncbi:MAG: FitA-like ribbon-helix-helix domain-containing protein [bacterium]
MPALTLRDIPAFLYKRLKEEAHRSKRSMNKQALSLLEKALLPPPKLNPADFPKAVKPRLAIDDAFIGKAIARSRA